MSELDKGIFKNEPQNLLHTMYNTLFKMGHIALQVKIKTMKLLKESTGNYFHDFGAGRGFSELKEHNLLKKKLINWTSSK